MPPLVLLALKLFPAILESVVGPRSTNVTAAVEKVVSDTAGASDPQAVEQKLAADPTLAMKVQIALAEIARDEKELELDAALAALNDRLAAEADARKVALDTVIERYKAQLAAMEAEHKATLDQRMQDLENTAGARGLLSGLVNQGSMIAYLPAILSLIVVIGFFLTLAIFVFMKSNLESQSVGSIPQELLDKIPSLSRDQIAALIGPRTDFVVQIINICVGSLTAAFATVISYWLGSSLGSRNKDAVAANQQDQNTRNFATQAKENADVAKAAMASNVALANVKTGSTDRTLSMTAASPQGQPAAADLDAADAISSAPVRPAAANVTIEALPELTRPHRLFPDSVTWALVAEGISIDGAKAQGTMGEPKTVRRIWSDFGPLCVEASKRYGVPLELVIATIATESSGDPNARRKEPRIKDESVGLMQTLVGTARSATGRSSLKGDDLLDPRTSIDAGTAYIASQRGSTHFDPPLVAAAYNAGSLRLDDGVANRWKMRCFPIGTGAHIDRFVSWFGDAMRVSTDDDWSSGGSYSTFATTIGSRPEPSQPEDQASPHFPPRPAFRALVSLEEKQAKFGRFDYVADPMPDNPEHVRILGDWKQQHIMTVEIPLKSFKGKAGPLLMEFHKAAAQQLIDTWLEWESAGLIDRVLSFDGSFVPRFQRGSTTKLSNHAFGTAFDINATSNPLGAEPAGMGEKGNVRELVPIANKHGFAWGGHFMTRKDGMHFEVAQLR